MKKFLRLFFLCFVSMILLGKGVHSLTQQEETETTNTTASENTASITFMGVGDNLLHDVIFLNMDQSEKDVSEYESVYHTIENYTTADLNYINFETICAGNENGFSLSGYPTFNGPTEFNDLIAKAGFNWLSLCSNHTYDLGEDGVLAELEYIEENQPDLTVTGAYQTEKASNTPTVIEVNGLKVGLASYCYGFENPQNNTWMVKEIDEDTIRKDLKALNKVSDVQIVSMHWGTEYKTVPNEEQEEYAKLLNELGVEVIIGTHPHVIEPVTWIKGDKQDTLCYYSLGNFVSAQNANDNMIGGLANFTLTYDFDTKETTITDIKFTPTITYYTESFTDFETFTISEWTDELAATSYTTVVEGQDISVEYVQNYVKDVMSDIPKDIEVIYE